MFLACGGVVSHTKSKIQPAEMEVQQHSEDASENLYPVFVMGYFTADKGSWPRTLSGPNLVLLSLPLRVRSQWSE